MSTVVYAFSSASLAGIKTIDGVCQQMADVKKLSTHTAEAIKEVEEFVAAKLLKKLDLDMVMARVRAAFDLLGGSDVLAFSSSALAGIMKIDSMKDADVNNFSTDTTVAAIKEVEQFVAAKLLKEPRPATPNRAASEPWWGLLQALRPD